MYYIALGGIVIVGILYVVKSLMNAATEGMEDYESDGDQKTKIRHESGI